MSKYLNVPNGDYKISVQTGGTIYLNTGFETGTVELSGNLLVKGTTTTVESITTTIKDNIITLNAGELGAGVTLNEAGIEIDRGQFTNAFFKYDEDVNGFIAINGASQLLPLATNEIDSRNQSLTLNAGSSTINVSPTVDYERKVFTYDGFGNLTGYNSAKADTIPNTQAVVDYVAYNFANVFLRQIGDGIASISSVEIDDEENTGNPSVIVFKIDAVPVAEVYSDRWDFSEVRITGTTIETINGTGSQDLVLRANGTGNVRIDDILDINSTASVPAFPTDGIRLYVDNQYTGKSGIYFANDEGNRDELVSKNRALLFGMLF